MGTSAATIAVCLTVWGYHPAREVPSETVDLIEINHFHDAEGRPVFDQVLFYDWSPSEGRYQVRDWRLLKSTNQIPVPSVRDGEFHSVWADFKARDTMRSTTARAVKETWTQYDPELVEREYLPENKRRKLTDVRTRRTPPSNNAASQRQPTSSPAALRPLQSPAPRRELDN